jgi:hypothetical protein
VIAAVNDNVMTASSLEATPLGRARRLIETATAEIFAAMDTWELKTGNPLPENAELKIDAGSLSFYLELDYEDHPIFDFVGLVAHLQPVLTKHGVASAVYFHVDSDSVDTCPEISSRPAVQADDEEEE